MTRKTKSEPDKNQGGFDALGLSNEMLATLKKIGFETPSPIQRELIPVALSGRDCIGQAKTGTGKTAAFSIPMLETVRPGAGVQALVLVPTRELAMQVDEHVRMLARRSPLKTLLVYGGTRVRHNLQRLKTQRDIIIGTPGRVLDLTGRGAMSLAQVKLVVLDEVDRMLDIGFRDDIRRILKQVTGKHQTIFVSATIDDAIRRLAKTYMSDPVEINVSADTLTVDQIDQEYVTVDPRHKFSVLLEYFKQENPSLAIVFTRTKRTARVLGQKLQKAGVKCLEIHGDLRQNRRSKVMSAFRKGRIHVLVATDLAARGLDVMDVSHIVNYDIPEDPAVYVHRIGRTARMGARGVATTFVTREQGKELTAIEMLINCELRRREMANAIDEAPESVATPAEESPPQSPSPPAAPPLLRPTVRRASRRRRRF
ncbi:MAG: DEAD/DEAH box helicase [Planctomycetota bacterium]|nr:MAG: DEAD/DEAH box helicase [Planctomycetota bacterium]